MDFSILVFSPIDRPMYLPEASPSRGQRILLHRLQIEEGISCTHKPVEVRHTILF